MDWKGIKCESCCQDLGCPTCGQLFPHLSVVFEDSKNRIGDKLIIYFCNNKCRDEWIERKRKFERRIKGL